MNDHSSTAVAVRDIGHARGLSTIEPIVPKNPAEVAAFAQFMIDTQIIPDSYATMAAPKKIGALVIAIMKGMELGLPPLRAVESIYVINGKPCLYGDMIPALLLASGKLEWFKEGVDGDGTKRAAWFEAKRIGNPEPLRISFSVADAAAMNLLNKAPWKHSRDRMLKIRARSYVARDLFADVLAGLAVFEEQSDIMLSQGLTPAAFASLPQSEDVDPLADSSPQIVDVIEDQTAPEESDWPGIIELDDPRTIEKPPHDTEEQWKALGKTVYSAIKTSPSPGTADMWWSLNKETLEGKSAALANWVKTALPKEENTDETTILEP